MHFESALLNRRKTIKYYRVYSSLIISDPFLLLRAIQLAFSLRFFLHIFPLRFLENTFSVLLFSASLFYSFALSFSFPFGKMNGCQWKIEFRGSSPQSRVSLIPFFTQRGSTIKSNDSTHNFLSTFLYPDISL